MDFFSIVCGAASLLWLAAGARWRTAGGSGV